MIFHTITVALLCMGTLCATENQFPTFELREHIEKPDPAEFKQFKEWILSQHPSPAKKALLTSTITSTHFPLSPTITWYKAHISVSTFKELLEEAYLSTSLDILTKKNNYDYKPDGAFWISSTGTPQA